MEPNLAAYALNQIEIDSSQFAALLLLHLQSWRALGTMPRCSKNLVMHMAKILEL